MTFSLDGHEAFRSRRSVVLTPTTGVASSQPLATEAGIHVLRAGGTAADAAVAMAAALQVTQPCSTGLGGDAFFLYYEATTRKVHAYNGSGRCPARLTLDEARRVAAEGSLPARHPYTVTVPGAADAWVALRERFGRLDLATSLAPAIRLAADGFPVAPMTAHWWANGTDVLRAHPHGSELLVDGRGPRAGERFRNPHLARVLQDLASQGRALFATGWVAERIAEAVQAAGGLLDLNDLAAHHGEWVEPISINYRGTRAWEAPPNGQGLAALLALNTYQHLHPESPAEIQHARIEAMRLAFADATAWIADPTFAPAPLAQLLDAGYAITRAKQLSMKSRLKHAGPGLPAPIAGGDTVYFAVVDGEGNGCSFINSNFMGFGTGIVPRGCGFSLQNRGLGFMLQPGHPNVLAPGKRPYHTIIPGLLTDETTGALKAVFGVMGGMMQPQGHFQVVSTLCDARLDPQRVLDAPRFCIDNGAPDGWVYVEDSMPATTQAHLQALGHDVRPVSGFGRELFGLGQIIAAGEDGIWWCGSDPRGDGQAGGF